MTNKANHTITVAVSNQSTGAQYAYLLRTLRDVRSTGSRLSVKMIGQLMRIVETDTDGDKMAVDVYPGGSVTDPFRP